MSRTAVRLSAALVAAACALVVGAPASAGATTREAAAADAACHRGPEAITAQAPNLYPENLTWDPTRRAFLVGSARYGTISTVGLDGTVRELSPAFGIVSTLGIKIDLPRNRFVVAYTDYWIRQAMPLPQPPTSGVAVFDLTTGRLEQRIPLFENGGSFANDLAVDAAGTIYVTNSVSATIVRITPDGAVTPFVTDPRFATTTVGPNGIVWHPSGYLLLALYDKGTLFRIPTTGSPTVRQVDLPQPLIGVDGLTLKPDGSVIAVSNSIGRVAGVEGGVDAVTVLRSRDGWRSARIAQRIEPWSISGPTAAATTPYGDYVLSGHVYDLMTGQGPTPAFTLNRI